MGICRADTLVTSYCNEVQERLLMDPLCPDEGWYGGTVTMALGATVVLGTAYVTVPREVCRLTDLAVCQDPIAIRNGFYEYLRFGQGLEPKTCSPTCGPTLQAYERDNVYTLYDLLSGPQTIRIYPVDNRDAGRKVLVQGLDANGKVILTTDPGTARSAPGEYIVIQLPFVDSTNTFTKITGLQKDETWGPVQLFQVDATSGSEVALSEMEPTEKASNYRRYLINGLTNLNACCTTGGSLQMTAQARLDFVPVYNETDYLTIPNVPALVEEALSLKYSRMDSSAAAQQSAVHHGRAIALLNGQLDKQLGKINTAVKVPIFGSNRLTRQPV